MKILRESISFLRSPYALLIILIGFLVYGNALFNDFVWDDKAYIILNPEIHNFNLYKLITQNVFNSNEVGQFRPIPAIYFSIVYQLVQDKSFFYHFLQISIHIASTLLLLKFFSTFFNKKISFFSALIFLVHPVQVESVSYIGSTGDALFFFFGMLALIKSSKKKLTSRDKLLVSLFLFLSFCSKETGALFLIVILVNRLTFIKGKVTYLFVPLLSSLGAYAFFRFVIAEVYINRPHLIPIARLSFFDRMANVPEVIFFYIKTFFFPKTLVHNQLWVIDGITFQTFFLPIVINITFFSTLGLIGIYCFKKAHAHNVFNAFIIFLSWLLAGLLLHSQILFPLDQTVEDRFFYFTIVGFIGMCSIILSLINPKIRIYPIIYFLLVLIIVLLSMRTIQRNVDWKNAINLYSHDMKIKNNFDIEMNLGAEYLFAGNYLKAIEHFENSVVLFPHEDNLYNLGAVYSNLGELERAKEYYIKALNSKNYNQKDHQHSLNLYTTLSRQLFLTDDDEAIRYTKIGLDDYPDSAELWIFLALNHVKEKNQYEAIKAATKAKMLRPGRDTEYLLDRIINNEPINFN